MAHYPFTQLYRLNRMEERHNLYPRQVSSGYIEEVRISTLGLKIVRMIKNAEFF